jgi:RNA polymerase sigma-32 factor
MTFMLAGPIGSLDQYIQMVKGLPVLSAEEERSLALRLHDDDDLDAARRSCWRICASSCTSRAATSGYGLPLGDLIQEGNVGLMKAVRRFDPAVGVRLVSFAVHWIRAEIHEFVLRNWRSSRSRRPRPSASCSSICARPKPTWAGSPDETEAVAQETSACRPARSPRWSAAQRAGRVLRPSDPTNDDDYAPAAYLPTPTATRPTARGTRGLADAHDRLDDALAQLDARSRGHPGAPLADRQQGDAARARCRVQRFGRKHPADRVNAIGKLRTMMAALTRARQPTVSGTSVSSTRRFSWRPATVSFVAIGRFRPYRLRSSGRPARCASADTPRRKMRAAPTAAGYTASLPVLSVWPATSMTVCSNSLTTSATESSTS